MYFVTATSGSTLDKSQKQEEYISLGTVTQWILCCCCSTTQSCLTLCDPMDSSRPGFLVLHYLLEFVCEVGDQLNKVAKVLEFQP